MAQQNTTDPKWITNLMRSYQHAVEDILEDAGFVVPDRNYICWNLPAWDEPDQLTIHCNSFFLSNPGVRPDQTRLDPRNAKVPAVKMTATLLRPVVGPDLDGNPPKWEDLDEEAADLHGQAWALWAGVAVRLTSNTLFDFQPEARWDKPVFNTSQMGDLQFLGPQGLAAGFGVPVVVSLGA